MQIRIHNAGRQGVDIVIFYMKVVSLILSNPSYSSGKWSDLKQMLLELIETLRLATQVFSLGMMISIIFLNINSKLFFFFILIYIFSLCWHIVCTVCLLIELFKMMDCVSYLNNQNILTQHFFFLWTSIVLQ